MTGTTRSRTSRAATSGSATSGCRAATVGAKRNLGCQLAAGEFVAQWDDDDWIGYNRLSTQVSELTAAGADVYACGELLHYRVDAGDAWLLRPRWPDAPDLPPGPLLYRRSLTAEHRFAASGSGEQRAFAAGLAPDACPRRRRPVVPRRHPSHQSRRSQPRRWPLDAASVRRGRRAARDRRALLCRPAQRHWTEASRCPRMPT